MGKQPAWLLALLASTYPQAPSPVCTPRLCSPRPLALHLSQPALHISPEGTALTYHARKSTYLHCVSSFSGGANLNSSHSQDMPQSSRPARSILSRLPAPSICPSGQGSTLSSVLLPHGNTPSFPSCWNQTQSSQAADSTPALAQSETPRTSTACP